MDVNQVQDPQALFAFLQQLQGQLQAQAQEIQQQQQEITNQNNVIQQQQQQLQHAQAPVVHVPAPVVNIPAPVINVPAAAHGGGLKVSKPEPYKGARGSAARSFLQAVEMYATLRPQDFPTDLQKIQWTLLLLQEKAASWAQPIYAEILQPTFPPTTRSTVWTAFTTEFRTAFFDPDEKRSASNRLANLRQTKSTAEYAAEFRELVSILGWNEDTQLQVSFYRGLKDHVKDDLASQDDPASLDELVTRAIRLDNRHWTRRMEKAENAPTTRPAPRSLQGSRAQPPTPRPNPAPIVVNVARDSNAMDLSANRRKLTPEERARRMRENLCLYCGQAGHRKDAHFQQAVAAVEVADPVVIVPGQEQDF